MTYQPFGKGTRTFQDNKDYSKELHQWAARLGKTPKNLSGTEFAIWMETNCKANKGQIQKLLGKGRRWQLIGTILERRRIGKTITTRISRKKLNRK